MAFKIERLYAFIAVDPDDGDEGIMGFETGRQMVPMIGADMDRVESLRKIADQLFERDGVAYRIKYFELVEE